MTRLVEHDRCPGVLRPYRAADGNMVRFRCPGGFLTPGQLRAVMDLAVRYAGAQLQVTSRNNLQIRALPDPLPEGFVAEAHRTGLLPDAAHERVRTIVCSPLTSVSAHHADLSGLCRDLDAEVISDPALAELPGRFLFVLDDGRGDVLGEAFDVAAQAQRDGGFVIFVGGCEAGRVVADDGIARTLVTIARRFVAANRRQDPPAWHTRELPRPESLLEGIGDPSTLRRPTAEHPIELGVIGGAASVSVPLGLLTADQVEALARAAGDQGRLILTPWRGVVVPGAAAAIGELTASGLVASSVSPWSTLTACYGMPCANSRCDTRTIAAQVAAVAPGPFPARVHISGCERVCGEPGGEHVSVVAPPDAATVLAAVG